MNELALFAGAGGGILGGHLLGWRTVCAVELDPYAASILVARQNDKLLPPFPIWGDIRTFDGHPWRGVVDVVSGGFPCQPFSTASRGRRTAKDLWPEMRRIVNDVRPLYVFAENVQLAAIERASQELTQDGYTCEYMPLSAAELGAPHVRERYWLLAHSDDQSQLRGNIDAEVAVMPCIRNGVWQADPRDRRVDDRMARRMERYTAIGNGQVPAVAAMAFRTLYANVFGSELEPTSQSLRIDEMGF